MTALLRPPLLGEQAQQPAQRFELRGRVFTPSGSILRWTFARVIVRSAQNPFSKRTLTNMRGHFKVKKLPPGTYIVTVDAGRLGHINTSLDVSQSFADSKRRVLRDFHLRPIDTTAMNQVSVTHLAIRPKAWRLYDKAQKLLGKGKTDEAIRELEKAVELTPGFPAALNKLGTIAHQQGRFAQAKDYFETSLRYDPDAYAPLVNLGGTLIALQDFEQAREMNSRAVRMSPNDALAHSQLGLTYEGLGEMEQAVESLTTAKKLEPGHFSYPQLPLARVYLKMGRPRAAIQELKAFLSLHPDSLSAEGVEQLLLKLESPQ